MRVTRFRLRGIVLSVSLAIASWGCADDATTDGAGGSAGGAGGGGAAGSGGSVSPPFGLEDPSQSFDIFDPNEDTEDRPHDPDTIPGPDAAVRAFFEALESEGGEAFLQFDHTHDGETLHVRVPIPEQSIVIDAAGVHADVDLGPMTVRVASAPDSSSPAPLLVASTTDLSSLVLVKTYTRTKVGGTLGPVVLDFVSVFEPGTEARGPIDSISVGNDPQLELDDDCEAIAFENTSEVPPMAINFPSLSGCGLGECSFVKSAWIRANHDVHRIRQMIEYLDTKPEAQRQFLWSQNAADPDGNEMDSNTSLGFYFGGYTNERFVAIRAAYNGLWDDLHDHNLEGLGLDIECRPGGGDLCNTFEPPAHHAVKSDLKICDGFFSQTQEYQALLIVHEMLHHAFIPFGGLNVAFTDLHTHGHGNGCFTDVSTVKFYGLSRVRHLAVYKAGNGNTCRHRDFAVRNNDTYGWVTNVIGFGVRNGDIHHWPFIPDPPQPGPACSGDGIPDPGDGWEDPVNHCMKIGQELVCEGGPSGPAMNNIPELDVAVKCP